MFDEHKLINHIIHVIFFIGLLIPHYCIVHLRHIAKELMNSYFGAIWKMAPLSLKLNGFDEIYHNNIMSPLSVVIPLSESPAAWRRVCDVISWLCLDGLYANHLQPPPPFIDRHAPQRITPELQNNLPVPTQTVRVHFRRRGSN